MAHVIPIWLKWFEKLEAYHYPARPPAWAQHTQLSDSRNQCQLAHTQKTKSTYNNVMSTIELK